MTDWLAYVLLLVFLLAGVAATLLQLPGVWLMVAAVGAYAWYTGFDVHVGWPALGTMISLALAAELAEVSAGAAGSRQAGGSRRSMLGAIIGALVGGVAGSLLLPVPILGTLVGVCGGAFVGASGMEMMISGDAAHATRVGAGAARGRLAGTLLKMLFAMLMLVVAMVTALPTGARTVPTTLPSAPVTQQH